jgi:RimJ/RimL family protein N-acetyltransferase
MELTDGTITLRSPTADDAADVAAAVRASLPTLQPWMPWASDDYDDAEALRWIRGEIEPGAMPLTIISPEGDLVGSTGLNHIDWSNRRANLGYWLHPNAVGHGWATRAVHLVTDHGFGALGLHRVEILMSVENQRSRRVAERVGAEYEGILRGRLLVDGRFHDAHSFALLNTAGTHPKLHA